MLLSRLRRRITSARDLMRFADALFASQLLQPASMEEMFTFVPSERPGIAWGMGVARMDTTGDLVGMAGDGPGFSARMFQHPESNLTLVLLTNTNRDDETVDVLIEQAVQTALESATSAAVAVAPTRDFGDRSWAAPRGLRPLGQRSHWHPGCGCDSAPVVRDDEATIGIPGEEKL